MVKQIIVAREDLCMTPGKLAAQVAHASMGALINKREMLPGPTMVVDLTEDGHEWLLNSFTKIVLGASSQEQLEEIALRCHENNVYCAIIEDNGRTEFNGEPTVTCLGIEPLEAEKVDKITGNLRLYKQREVK